MTLLRPILVQISPVVPNLTVVYVVCPSHCSHQFRQEFVLSVKFPLVNTARITNRECWFERCNVRRGTWIPAEQRETRDTEIERVVMKLGFQDISLEISRPSG